MENLTGGTPPVRYLPCVVPCKLYFAFGKTDLSVITFSITDVVVLFVGCLALLFVDILHEKNLEVRQIIETKNYWVQVAFWTIVIQMIACFGRVASAGGFMYANF